MPSRPPEGDRSVRAGVAGGALWVPLVVALALGFAGDHLGAYVSLPTFLVVIVLGGIVIGRGEGDLGRLTELGTPENGPVAAVLAGTVLAFYSYVGFETSVNIAEETKDPARSSRRACSA